MKSGMICAPENILNHVCYEVGVKELIVKGYLSPLVTKASRIDIDTSGLHVRAGEFVADEAEELMNTDELVEAACNEIIGMTETRQSVLIFAAGVEHGRHIAEVMSDKFGVEAETVFGNTHSQERDSILEDFRGGVLKYLINVNVLTTGFDAPNIDCVAMVRPTLSPGLYYQMVGRGFRLHEGKENCLVLDFGGNVLRHGPVDAVRIRKPKPNGNDETLAKQCPECRSVIAAGYTVCPDCGYEFPQERRRHEATASTEVIITGEATTTEHDVHDVSYSVHRKRGASEDAPCSMRVEYRLGFYKYQSEWICFEHTGYARKKAESWWRRRSNVPVPKTAEEAVELADDGALCETSKIVIRSVEGEKYDSIVGYELDDKPFWREPGSDDCEVSESVPEEVTWVEPF
jgi:DNA repair protein RadD